VDYSDINRDISRRIIEQAGGNVILVENGQIAMDLLPQQSSPNIDLVLFDLQMPVLDGYETTRRLLQIPKYQSVPVVALTAGITDAVHAAAIHAGVVRVLTKPFTIEQIVCCFHELLAPVANKPLSGLPLTNDPVPNAITGEQNKIRAEELATPALSDHTHSEDEPEPILDESAALKNWGDKASLQHFLRQFEAQYSDSAEQIQALVQSGEIEQAEKLAHKAKGAAASLYLVALKSEFGCIEQDLREIKKTNRFESLSLTLTKTLDAITQYRGE